MRLEICPSAAAYARKVGRLVQQATAQGAQLIVFPEYTGVPLLGLLPGIDKLVSTSSEAGKGPGPSQASLSLDEALKQLGGAGLSISDIFRVVAPGARRAYLTIFAEMARRTGASIVAGSIVLPGPDGGLYNTAMVFGPTGRCIGQQQKAHLMPIEASWRLSVGQGIAVFDMDFGRLSVPVCMDHTYWESARLAYLAGADILVDPAFDDQPYHPFMQARGVWGRVQESPAYGLHCYMVGDLLGFHPRGVSGVYAPLAMTPRGDGILASAQTPDQEEIVLADLDLASLRRYRAEHPLDLNRLYRRYLPSAYGAYLRRTGGRRASVRGSTHLVRGEE